MASEEHLEILRKGIAAWNEWREANLDVRPDLADANLDGANLDGANLTDATLTGANLDDATLTGANLDGANLRSTVIADIDLRQVEGLEAVYHHGPSTVGTNTLERSHGQIPAAFLRGCGLSDWEILAAKLWNPDLTAAERTDITYEMLAMMETGGAFDFFSAFISYSHDDKAFARALHDELQSRGVRCWLDEHQIAAGDDIYDAVDRGIRLWDKVLLLCSESSLNSWWVEDEIDKGLEKERKLRKERGKPVLAIIPLDLDGHLFNWTDGRAATLRKRYAPDFKGWKPGDELDGDELDKVIRALRSDGREPPPEPKL